MDLAFLAALAASAVSFVVGRRAVKLLEAHMAFTPITVTGTFDRPDGQPAQGTVTATLSARMVNGTEVIEPTPITGQLDAAGALKDDSGAQPFTLAATDDPGTTPTGAVYEFVLELDSAPIDPFTAVVPHAAAAGTIDLTELMP